MVAENNKQIFWMQPPYNENGNYYRQNDIPQRFKTIIKGTKYPMDDKSIVYHYMKLNPDRFENEEIGVFEKSSDLRFDVEHTSWNLFLVSESFMRFCKDEDIQFDFFPVLSEGECRYMAFWRKAPVLGEYEVDTKNSVYRTSKERELSAAFLKTHLSPRDLVFSSSYLDSLSIDTFFTFATKINLYCTHKMQQAIENAGFEVYWTKFKANETPVDLVESTRKQQILWLNETRREKYQRSYDYLEQILIAEGDKDVIERFNVEIKSKWEDQFIRFANGTLPPDERVKVW